MVARIFALAGYTFTGILGFLIFQGTTVVAGIGGTLMGLLCLTFAIITVTTEY